MSLLDADDPQQPLRKTVIPTTAMGVRLSPRRGRARGCATGVGAQAAGVALQASP